MPVIIDNRLLFFRIPKTGSTSMQQSLCRAFNPERVFIPENAHDPIYPSYIARILHEGMIPFCFVRRPHTWLQSVWADAVTSKDNYWTRNHKAPDNQNFHDFINDCLEPDFQGFIRRYLKYRKGFVGEYFDTFILGGYSHVGRQETMFDDLEKFLLEADCVPDQPAKLRHDTRFRERASSPEWKERVEYGPGQLAAVQKAEGRIYNLYYGGKS